METDKLAGRGAEALGSRVGLRISRRRTAQGLTLAELGVASGLKGDQLRLYETGAEAIPLAPLLRLAVALRTPIDQLLDAPD